MTKIKRLMLLSSLLFGSLYASLVPSNDWIDDFQTRRTYAKELSYQRKSLQQALNLYTELLSERPDDFELYIEKEKTQYLANDATKRTSLVSKQDWIDEFQAQKIYAKELTYNRSTLQQALDLYTVLLSEHPEDFSLFLDKEKALLNAQDISRGASLVPKKDWVGDREARLLLAKMYGSKRKNHHAAILQYRILLSLEPYNPSLLLALAEIYTGDRDFVSAFHILDSIDVPSDDRELQLKLANIEATLGYAELARTRFENLLAEGSDASIQESYANAQMSYGNFYQAEKIYRQNEELQPIKVIDVLAAMQRYDEAEELCQIALVKQEGKMKGPFLLKLNEIKRLQKDNRAALVYAEMLVDIDYTKSEYLFCEAETLFALKEYRDALECYESLLDDSDYFSLAILGAGRCCLEIGQQQDARYYLEQALLDTYTHISARFFLEDCHCIDLMTLDKIINEVPTAQELQLWAEHFSQKGMHHHVERIYQAAVALDEGYFPALSGQAEALSSQMAFGPASEIYNQQIIIFPDNAKLLLARARVASWDRQYWPALSFYDQLISLNPDDPVPRLEQARVACWAKFHSIAMQYYNELLEVVENKIDHSSLESSELALQLLIEKVRLEIDFQISKWDKHPLHTFDNCRELLYRSPGSEYWQFECGQCLHGLGLSDRSNVVYNSTLDVSPGANLAAMALDRSQSKLAPCLFLNYIYWNEKGYGELSQIGRYEGSVTALCPISHRQHITYAQRHWVEHTLFDGRYHPADGQTIEWGNRFDQTAVVNAAITRKKYRHRFGTTYTGFWSLNFNLLDMGYFEFGYKKADVVCNYFNLKQKTQEDLWWGRLHIDLSHTREFDSILEYTHYNDFNTQVHGFLTFSWALTEHPQVCKIGLTAEYRNTAHKNIFIYGPTGKLRNIIYPYWTPQDYFLGQILFEYRHDYGDLQFSEAPVRFYDVKIAFGDDSQNNHYFSVKGEWQHEFYSHWKFILSGLVHRSPQWNAKGIWCTLAYQF